MFLKNLTVIASALCLLLILGACGAKQADTSPTPVPVPAMPGTLQTAEPQRPQTTMNENNPLSAAEEAPLHLVDTFVIGGLQLSNGTGSETSNTKRMRTGYWPLESIQIEWSDDAPYSYCVAFYDDGFRFLTYLDRSKERAVFREGDIEGAGYVRFLLIPDDKAYVFSEDFTLPEGCLIKSSAAMCVFTADVPQSRGVQNLLKRAEQCVNLSYQTAALLPGQTKDIPAGAEVRGIMYSSVREESLYVPNCVSFYTYLTAMLDPNSYVYTRLSAVSNSKTYYGTVCSAFASYCYDLDAVYSTHVFGHLDGFDRMEDQSPDALQLGDMWLKENAHVGIVTEILRDETGRVAKVTISQATQPNVISKQYSRGSFQKTLNAGYVLYRYRDLESITYEELPYLRLRDEDERAPVFNRNLCPRRGDRANWPLGEAVEIDVLDREFYTAAELYRNDELFSAVTALPDNDCLVFENLPYGNYRLALTDGSRESESVSFIVVDAHVSAEAMGDGRVKISFSSQNAVPDWYAWCFPRSVESRDNGDSSGEEDPESNAETVGRYMGAAFIGILTEEERKAGCAVSTFTPGDWMIKVEFKTDFGVHSSVPIAIHVT